MSAMITIIGVCTDRPTETMKLALLNYMFSHLGNINTLQNSANIKSCVCDEIKLPKHRYFFSHKTETKIVDFTFIRIEIFWLMILLAFLRSEF